MDEELSVEVINSLFFTGVGVSGNEFIMRVMYYRSIITFVNMCCSERVTVHLQATLIIYFTI